MIGKTILHYQILEKLGEGGMGVVYLAEDTKLKRKVAIKFLPRHIAASEEERERFKIEAQAAAALNHPNIATIYAIEEADDETFIVMEHIEGQELRDVIRNVGAKHSQQPNVGAKHSQQPIYSKQHDGARNASPLRDTPLPVDQIISIATQIAEGLQAAHEKGITHRDIKPSNIMITGTGRVKIMDFGLAKMLGGAQVTRLGTTIGTAAYMSPEQAKGESVDQRTDVWSLGVVLYEMLTGQSPFGGGYEQAVIYSIINEEMPPVAELQPAIPENLQNVVAKALAKNRDERYQNAGELLADLRAETNENLPSTQKRKSTEKPFAGKKWAIAAGLVAIAILLVFAIRYGFNVSKSTPVVIEKSIAVLPFSDLSPAKDQEYFCDGMTEQIISNLSHLENLKVIARTSVMKFKNTEKTIPEIGRELKVSYVLEGSIRKAGDRIRVTAQLVKSDDGYQLRGMNFDKELKDVFAVQDEVSEAIATALFKELTTTEVSRLKSTRSMNVEAYEYYLKGRYFHDQKFWGVTFKEEDFLQAKAMFQKAIELDPSYALAYAGLADLYDTYLTNIQWNPEYDGLRQSLIEKAYSLDPNLPYVLEVLSYVLERQGKLDEAYSSLQKALEFSPNESEYNLVMGIFLRGQGLIPQSIRYFTTALQQNPLDNMIYIYRGNSYMVIGDYAAAEADIKKALQIEPQHVVGLNLLAQLSIMKKDYEAAEAYLSQCEIINPNYRDYKITKAWLLAARGEKEKALAAHEDDIVYLLLGLSDEALHQLAILLEKDWSGTQALYRHDCYLALKNLPFYDSIRNDPRFIGILEKEKKKYEGELQKYGEGYN